MNSLHPVKAFSTWYDALPRTIQVDIAAHSLLFLPNPLKTKALEHLVEPIVVFKRWLNVESDSTYRIVGRVLHIRSVMEFYLISRNGDSHDWEEKKRTNDALIEHFTAMGEDELVEKLSEGGTAAPDREKAWAKAIVSWRGLCQSSLSFEVLETWMAAVDEEEDSEGEDSAAG